MTLAQTATPQTAVITGASSGIGAALAVNLARRGYSLGLIGRDRARLEAVAVQCGTAGATRCELCVSDIRDGAAFGEFVTQFGAIDLFISNAGVLDGRSRGEVVETGEAALTVLDINLRASIEALHHVLETMRARRSGQIVLISSLAGLSPIADAPAYSASKAGLIAYGLALREALGDKRTAGGEGIGVTIACPGYVATRMGERHIGNRPHEISAEDAAARILGAAFANKALCGFPFPLYPMAHLSLMLPEQLRRLFTRGLRFDVERRPSNRAV